MSSHRYKHAVIVAFALAGCSRAAQWEIAYKNQGTVPCSFFVEMGDGSSQANVADVGKSDVTRLLVGPGETIVRSIKVVRGEEEKILTPDAKLGPGDRYVIVVTADGKVEAALK